MKKINSDVGYEGEYRFNWSKLFLVIMTFYCLTMGLSNLSIKKNIVELQIHSDELQKELFILKEENIKIQQGHKEIESK